MLGVFFVIISDFHIDNAGLYIITLKKKIIKLAAVKMAYLGYILINKDLLPSCFNDWF